MLDILRSARLLDRSSDLAGGDILYPFALEELLCREVGKGADPIVHLWRHPRAFVMGLRDSRLPGAVQAKSSLTEQGYAVTVRNSGGAAVPLDAGVINMTIIIPKAEGKIDFHDDFERMYQLVSRTLSNWTDKVRKGEIGGSYCPGDYDLSIDGRKFCGIAQRRLLKAIAVQAFIVVEGKGMDYAEGAQAFYEQAACGQEADYPQVTSHSMVSLAEAIGEHVTAQSYLEEIKSTLNQLEADKIMKLEQLPAPTDVESMIGTLRDRYDIPSPRK
ncbi:lipoate--protein ligase family protein [Paenibacillus albiflavus]|uniref:Lipoate--protein ligase family protein n=1 Tax=Paenibacillus albiflavus TaxID=2545760 RepID=A0A4V2WNX8_9BACL|nr:lipoate--protein ligase family protein [Paenibacillus albiflavus]TCZ77202.1 lipoate--protein ligase family protein [Paenibacillus albiflavus]